MSRQAHKVVYGNVEALNKNLQSSFAKASFVSVEKDQEIDLDDPQFWSKAIGLDKPIKEASKLAPVLAEGAKRNRTSKLKYDPNEVRFSAKPCGLEREAWSLLGPEEREGRGKGRMGQSGEGGRDTHVFPSPPLCLPSFPSLHLSHLLFSHSFPPPFLPSKCVGRLWGYGRSLRGYEG